jgi:hypothetical protein
VHDALGAEAEKRLDEVVDERVVVVDEQDHYGEIVAAAGAPVNGPLVSNLDVC